MIIDVHAHLGYDFVFDEDFDEGPLLHWCKTCQVDCAIVQPAIPRPYIRDTEAIHDRIAAFAGKHRGFLGMASINPHFAEADYERELLRCVRELGFVGLKISPIGQAANPANRSMTHIYELCRSLQLPLMIHTGLGSPFADPLNVIVPAKAFPEVKFILAHAGSDAFFAGALYVAEHCPNVYLEPSWLNIYSLKEAMERIGAERIMFSSDMPMNIPVELAKYRTVTDDAVLLEQMLSGTARQVFNLDRLLN